MSSVREHLSVQTTERLRQAYADGERWDTETILGSDAALRQMTIEIVRDMGHSDDVVSSTWLTMVRADATRELYRRALDALANIKMAAELLTGAGGLSASTVLDRGQAIIDQTTPFLNLPD